MRLRRRLPIPIALLLIAGAIVLIVTLRKHAPPEAARLLPGADGFVYINLEWLRTFGFAGKLPSVSHEPEYQDFVDKTGFQFERDLDRAAFAIHYAEPAATGTSATPSETRFSEVFIGKVDSARFSAYLKGLSSSVDDYRGFNIYNIPLEGRTLRVVLLSYDSVAASNHPDPAVIRGIVDRSRKLASPFGGPSLLRRFYGSVPIASLAFAILRVSPDASSPVGFGTWGMLFPKPAVTVVSARYFPGLRLRAEVFAHNADEAHTVTEKSAAFLSIFHAAEGSVGVHGSDPDVKAFFDSLKIEQSGNRAILTATVPQGFMKKILSESPADVVAPAANPAPPPQSAPSAKTPPKAGSH